MKLRALVTLLPMILLSACNSYTSVRSSAEYPTILSREPLLILPVKSQAVTVSTTGQERMYNYEESVEPVIMEELKAALEQKGYRATVLRKSDLMADKRYREYENLTSALDTKVSTLYGSTDTAKKEIAENTSLYLDGKAKQLKAKIQSPVLVYANYSESVSTSGKEATEFMAGVLVSALTGVSTATPPDSASIRISIIDANQDKLLWTNSGASLGGDLVDDMLHDNKEQSLNHIKKTIKWALLGLPDKENLFKDK